MSNRTVRSPIKIHGGKYYLAKWIISHFPENYENLEYVEPFFGGGNVLFNKNHSERKEIISDIDYGIVSLFRCLRSCPEEFIGKLKKTKYTESVFEREKKKLPKADNIFDRAIAEFVTRRMSRGGMQKKFAWSERTRGGLPGDENAWKTIIKELPALSARLQKVHIINQDAVEVVKACNHPETFVYCDPPYLHETRTAKSAYNHEMTEDQHVALLSTLDRFEGKAMISGYESDLYNDMLKDWKCEKQIIANHSSQTKKKQTRTECIWFNY